MSNNREVLFLKEVNGVNEWFENGNEKTDAKYVGEIKKGVPNGTGTNTWPSGAMYKGNFKDGHFHGQGTRTLPDGSKLVGIFKDDEPWNTTENDKEGTIIGKIVNGVEQK